MRINEIKTINGFQIEVNFTSINLFSPARKTAIFDSLFLKDRYNHFVALANQASNINQLLKESSGSALLISEPYHDYEVIRGIKSDNVTYFNILEDFFYKNFVVRGDYINEQFKVNNLIEVLRDKPSESLPVHDQFFHVIVKTFEEALRNGKFNLRNREFKNNSSIEHHALSEVYLNVKSNSSYASDLLKNIELRHKIFSTFLLQLLRIKSLTSILLQTIQLSNASIEKHKSNSTDLATRFDKLLMNYFSNTHYPETRGHEFVKSATRERENKDFGFLGERALYNYLKIKFTGPEWSSLLKNIYNDYYGKKFNDCILVWNNQTNESFKDHDISIRLNESSPTYFIDAKTTRQHDSNILITVKELEKALKNPRYYIIVRVVFIESGKVYTGTKIHDEFIANFYRFNDSAIKIIQANIVEWKEHYKENSIRFSLDHLTAN